MSGADIVVDTTRRIFLDLGDPQTVNNANDDAWRAPLWSALEDAGLTRAWLAEDLGGAGAEIGDGFAILRAAGSCASPVPLAETLLAAWLLGRAGIAAPDGAMAVAPMRAGERIAVDDGGRLDGTARGVAFAGEAAHLAVLCERDHRHRVALVARADCRVVPGTDLAGQDRSDVVFDQAPAVRIGEAGPGLDAKAVALMGAAVRCAQMTGALEAVLDMAVAYAGERVAFGRPIAKFQAIQHELARLAGETASAIAASGSAAAMIGGAAPFDDRVIFEIAAAKVRVGEAARDGAAIAHQVHGAIGFTEEHVLHRFTRRLWAWREDFGGESVWAARLGEMVCAQGADAFWPTVTAA